MKYNFGAALKPFFVRQPFGKDNSFIINAISLTGGVCGTCLYHATPHVVNVTELRQTFDYKG